jgi:pectate lyase
MAKSVVVVGLFSLLLCAVAHAHRPIFSDQAATDPNTAVLISQPAISQVIYREINDEAKQVWLAFDADEGFELFIQIGVPVLDRLKDFRPAMVVVGPGLPEENAPFTLPESTGAAAFTTTDIKEPRFFHEHFTGTDSWILRSETVALPKSGRYYLVAYVPSGENGKLWLSVGQQESFGLAEWSQFGEWKKKIRRFHEVREEGGFRIPILSEIGDLLGSVATIGSTGENENKTTTGIKAVDGNDSSKYLAAVREFADNVLKYGRDTYGPKKTPLFVDGLNIHTHEPVKWISPKGDPLTATETEEWILSNFASQQTLLRTLDGLSTVTEDPKYRDAAKEAIKYAFDNLRSPSGLFYWGEGTAYDALGDRIRTQKSIHSIKVHYPYYELMWQVSPKKTERFIEAYWSAHIIDWSNLDFDRGIIHIDALVAPKTPWSHEYEGGPTFFKSKISWAAGFFHTGTSLAHATTTLYRLSSKEQPLTWSKRLIQRFINARHPTTGITPHLYNRPQRSFVGGGMERHFSDPRVGVFPTKVFVHPFTGVRSLYYTEEVEPHIWLSLLLAGESLGDQGKEFTQWAKEELTAWGKASYRAKDNVFIPILTDGTSIEGVVLEKTGLGAPKGSVARPVFADAGFFWAYATAYRITGDESMWQMTRDIVRGNSFGDIGEVLGQTPALNEDTDNADAYSLFGFLELHKRTGQKEFLSIARRIGDNILASKYLNGFFVPSKKHVYVRFDCYEPLALLHLITALTSSEDEIPQVWPNSPNFVAPYRYKQQGIDRQNIYTVTDIPKPPLSLQEAAAIGDANTVTTLIENGMYIDRVEDAFLKTALHRAVISSHANIVELLLAKGSYINAEDGVSGATALHYAAEYGQKEIAELLIDKGADINAKRGKPANDTPLHTAVRKSHRNIVEVLISKGADVNAKNGQGKTPIEVVGSENRQEIIDLLKKHGAKE